MLLNCAVIVLMTGELKKNISKSEELDEVPFTIYIANCYTFITDSFNMSLTYY